MRLEIPDSFDADELLRVLVAETRRQGHRIAGAYVGDELVASIVPERRNVISIMRRRAVPGGAPPPPGTAQEDS